jgi:hypothetical protein
MTAKRLKLIAPEGVGSFSTLAGTFDVDNAPGRPCADSLPVDVGASSPWAKPYETTSHHPQDRICSFVLAP